MKEAADGLSFFASGAGEWRFFALLFPGIIALAVHDLRVPGERRKWGDMGIALVAYSVIIDVFWRRISSCSRSRRPIVRT